MAEPLNFKPYTLSPLDHILMPMHAYWFLSYHLQDPRDGAAILNQGLSSLVSQWPNLAGNITKSTTNADKSNILEVHPPSQAYLGEELPMLITRYHPDKPISLISSSPETVFTEDFIPGDPKIPTSYPTFALRFQANIMKDGIILTVCFHHQFVDGYGIVVILQSLSHYCQFPTPATEAPLMCPPSDAFGRGWIAANSASRLQNMPDEYGSSGYAHNPKPNYPGELSVNRKYSLDPEKITVLKNACLSLLPDLVDSIQSSSEAMDPLTTDDIVSALLWFCCMRARLGPSPTRNNTADGSLPSVSCTRIVESRRLLHPTLLRNHIGNCIALAKADCTAHDLESAPTDSKAITKAHILTLTKLAWKSRTACRSITREYVQGIINHVAGCSDWSSSVMLPPDVAITSLRKMDIYGFDFGSLLGRVVSIEVLENRLEGYCYILPRHPAGSPAMKEGKSLWEVRIALKKEAIDRLEHDELFSWVRTCDRARL
ncbi:hypothetical protein BO94DRAFT_589852 [Aspergillus sclerotioniger CBS 115572]|uniref:Uncharacterized protein n=1 Tax=Aspergillus sclerotioniger CBS 115572 TaxID=1450535 RepID=A0A317VBQ4_9EURO|nr:hypothetical protein BO94DRAFT_589852 [Aspergillus sclerotioniger CBS 115572]PWY71784.1 hypothetical protein BO94DRAFT_589852 [Aspergillus sclerotioniger CBS 115572]